MGLHASWPAGDAEGCALRSTLARGPFKGLEGLRRLRTFCAVPDPAQLATGDAASLVIQACLGTATPTTQNQWVQAGLEVSSQTYRTWQVDASRGRDLFGEQRKRPEEAAVGFESLLLISVNESPCTRGHRCRAAAPTGWGLTSSPTYTAKYASRLGFHGF